MTLNIKNLLVQTDIELDGNKIFKEIRGILVNVLHGIFPGVYDKYVLNERKQNIMYVRMLKALYVMIFSSIMYYKNFRQEIEVIVFKVNPYDICAANLMKYCILLAKKNTCIFATLPKVKLELLFHYYFWSTFITVFVCIFSILRENTGKLPVKHRFLSK